MDAVRCVKCGETRWTLFSGSLARLLGERCRWCGGEMVVERRRPGTSGHTLVVERRDHAGAAR